MPPSEKDLGSGLGAPKTLGPFFHVAAQLWRHFSPFSSFRDVFDGYRTSELDQTDLEFGLSAPENPPKDNDPIF